MASEVESTSTSPNEKTAYSNDVTQVERVPERVAEINNALARVDSYRDDRPVHLGRRTWLVIFVMLFSSMTQIFVVVAAGQVIAFIIRDLGNPGIAGWIIQGPLLMQAVLSPVVGRLSDVLDRKWVISVPYIFSFIGACVSATAKDMNTLIGGGILVGVALSTLGIGLAIPSEILPLKYRPVSGGVAFLGGAIGGLVGILGAGGVTNADAGGWRNIFWMQAAFHAATFFGLVAFYHPVRRSDYPRLNIKEFIWSMDPIGSFLMVSGTALMLLSLDWAGSAHPWKSPDVLAPLCIGGALIIAFSVYEWKGRSDGLVAHAFFKKGRNFPLAMFSFGVEGWIFYSAVNSITPQISLNLGWETTAWHNATRQMTYQVPSIVASILIVVYSTVFKDLKYPLAVSFGIFLIVTIVYANISPSMNHAQLGINVVTGFGQAGPLTLIPAIIQFSAPHAMIATASGLAATTRALGGAFGSAVLDAIVNSKLSSTLAPQVGGAAIKAGLPASSVPALMEAFATGAGFDDVPGINPTILAAASNASHWAYAHAYRLAWASIIPFVALAFIGIMCLTSMKEMMTEHVQATVERPVDVEVVEERV